MHEPPPVGVGAVQRGFHQGRVGDPARGRLDAASAPTAAHDHAGDPRGALAVGHHHDRRAGAAARRAPRRSAARPRSRGRPATPLAPEAISTAVSLVESSPVDRAAVERALDAHAEQQLGGVGLERRVGLHEAQHRGEVRRDHARALALGGEAHRPGGQPDLEVGALLERVGRLDRLLEVGVALAAQLPARGEDALQHRLDRQVAADPAGGAEHDLLGLDAQRRARRRPASWPRRPGRVGRSRRWRSPSWRAPRAGRPGGSARGSASTGAAAVPLAVKRAALTGRSESHTSRPRSWLPLGLIPHADARGAEANRQSRVGLQFAHVLGRGDPPRAEERPRRAVGAPVAPHVVARAHRILRSRAAEHQVEVLHRLRGGALPEVVDRREHDHLAGVRRRRRRTAGRSWCPCTSRMPGGTSTHLDERLGGVGVARRARAAPASSTRRVGVT